MERTMKMQVKLPEPGTRAVILKWSIKCRAGAAVSKLFMKNALRVTCLRVLLLKQTSERFSFVKFKQAQRLFFLLFLFCFLFF